MDQQLTDIYAALMGGDAQAMQEIGWLAFLFLMGLSLAASFAIAFFYEQFYGNRATGSQVHRAFPLLGVSITAIFVCIQFSLPLSLGLLGALSIVRFRTPIKEPEEIGFIMLVIATAIACATLKIMFLGVIFLVAVIALLIQNSGRILTSSMRDGVIVISVPAERYASSAEAIAGAVTTRVGKARLESVSKHDDEMVLSYNFQDLNEPALRTLHSDLDEIAHELTFNIFFNRPGVT